jgi:hypothetical protein
MQLGIVLTSLQDNQHIATVLGLTSVGISKPDSEWEGKQPGPRQEPSVTVALEMAERLMKTILSNLAAHTVSGLFAVIILLKNDLNFFM